MLNVKGKKEKYTRRTEDGEEDDKVRGIICV